MFSIDINKSPGPDGFGSGFFKSSWKIVGEEVTTAILEFLVNGQLLNQINATMTVLIQKVEHPMFAR